jgi:polar amino acid transport system ATP-binding protein
MNLNIENMSKHYGKLTVFDKLDLKLDDVKSVALIGPSGEGKTTLLRLIADLEKADSGNISLNREHKGMVFQLYNLFPHLTALQNIILPLTKVHNIGKKIAEQQAIQLLQRFNLSEHANKKPAQLSGGQQQRIAICRAVATNPDILLFDEPTSALDPEYTAEVLDLIAELRQEGMEIIFVTHEMGFAKQVADRILFVADGGISFCGTADDFFGEAAPQRVKEFLGKVLKYN